jgi:hypothetical protein
MDGDAPVADLYRECCAATHAKPSRSAYQLVAAAVAVDVRFVDLSSAYVGNRQLLALTAVAARCPRLMKLDLRRQELFSGEVLREEAHQATPSDAATVPAADKTDYDAMPDAGAAVEGMHCVCHLAAALTAAVAARAPSVPLVLDLSGNALGTAAGWRLLQLARAAPYITAIVLDDTMIDASQQHTIDLQCRKNKMRL